jgi:hypothetical protein
MAGTAVAGTAVEIDGAASGLAAAGGANGLCLMGTCMGTDPIPIWTEGADVGAPAVG